MSKHNPILKSISLAAVIALAGINSAQADALVVGGGQVGSDSGTYGTVGAIVPLSGSELGNGWVGRIFAEEVSYRYKAGDGQNVDANGFGGALTFGYQHSLGDGWVGAYAGPAYRYVHLSPNDPGSDVGGSNVMARFQVEGEQNLTHDFKLNGSGVYDAFNTDAYWARLRALYRVSSGDTYLGPEGSFQGDENYKAWEGGLALVGIPLTNNSSFGIDGGARKQDGENLGGYGGLEFGLRFP